MAVCFLVATSHACRTFTCNRNTNGGEVEQLFARCSGHRRRTCLQYSANIVHLVSIQVNTGATQVVPGVVAPPVRSPHAPTLDTLRTDVCRRQLRRVPRFFVGSRLTNCTQPNNHCLIKHLPAKLHRSSYNTVHESFQKRIW